MNRITFGTSGWRGILCEDFTYDNIKTVVQAIADHVTQHGDPSAGLVVGYDARFMGKEFAHEAVRVLAAAGIPSYVCRRDTPTPVIAYEILRRGTAGAINFTASHNPHNYNGVKFSPAWGGPALPETTKDIEQRANAMLGEVCYREMALDQAHKAGLVEEIDPHDDYCRGLREHVDLAAIAKAGLRVAVNPLYGSGRGYLDGMLEEAGTHVVRINDHLDPYFGGMAPEPSKSHMGDFIRLMTEAPDIHLGLATDGDADRFGVVDADGTYIEPNYVLALLYDYLLRRRKLKGDAARSVATSHFIDAVAAQHGQRVFETPVGFKWIGDYIRKGEILIGGEESAGLSVRGHVPEKDGILACLLVAEMVAVEGATLSVLLEDLYRRVGAFHTRRENLHLTSVLEDGIEAKLTSPPAVLAGRQVEQVVRTDGCKLLLADGSWALFRKSGTEPVVRVYAEAQTEKALDEVMRSAAEFVLG